QDVRSPGGDGSPLLDAEPVLLVDDGDRERAELDVLLDQRVRADDEVGPAAGERSPRGGVLPSGQRARQEEAADAEPCAERLDGEEMLLGERLRRRHQRALMTAFHGAKQGVQGHDRLAGAHVPLEETLHRARPGEIPPDLPNRVLLLRREHEWQQRAIPLDQRALLPERRRLSALLELLPPPQQPELEQQELLERKALAGRLG